MRGWKEGGRRGGGIDGSGMDRGMKGTAMQGGRKVQREGGDKRRK